MASTAPRGFVQPDGPALASGSKSGLVTGFDLDMTLIDSRPGIQAVYDRISRETGVRIDSALVVTRLGPPTELEMANWFPPAEVAAAVRRYRDIYPDVAVGVVRALPGALDAVAAARERGRVILVTAKAPGAARLHLEHLGIDMDDVYGLVWRGGKADVLTSEGADVYVGDHTEDMAAACAAGAFGVGVASGPCSEAELLGAGAGCTVASLRALPAWMAAHRP